ncbi:Guanylate cyclase (Partial), partial [Seminavis robusta]|eukprot:Sro1005_g230180.1 Guanylate cyclase (508) ;mRNA; r:95-1909
MGSLEDATNDLSQNLEDEILEDGDSVVFSDFDNEFSSTTTFNPPPARDEKKEVYKMSAKDTRRVQLWRVAMTLALLLTALGVTLTTYLVLIGEESKNFETAFTKFSRTVGDAAIDQQKNFRDSIRGLAHLVSGQASTYNLSWPTDKDKFTNYTTKNYQQIIQSAHLMQNGDFRRLNNDTSVYKPFISKNSPQGYLPDDDRDEYWPSTGQFSPPPATYGIVNWNVHHIPPLAFAIDASVALKYETTFTMITPYRSVDLIMTKAEHAAKHSDLLDSTPEHPHTFAVHPIHRDPLNADSEIVGIVVAALALDVALLNLLPEGVQGIHCIISKNMNQTFTYEIIGNDAIYLGEGDMHEEQYTDMGVFVDLALHTNPEYRTTPRNTLYRMDIYPSSKFEDTYHTGTPQRFAIILAVVFVSVAVTFLVYDLAVQHRNENLVSKAAQSNAIVSSLFPDNIRERLMNDNDESQQAMNSSMHSKRGRLKAFLNDGKNGSKARHQSKPLADLFLETTV